MKLNKILFIPAIALCLALSAFTGCTTTNVKSPTFGVYNTVGTIGVKDYKTLGLVRVETTVTTKASILHLSTTTTGRKVNYSDLLAAAKTLYPKVDELINVRIDTVKEAKSGVWEWIAGGTNKVTYVGTALAIQYTDALQNNDDDAYSEDRTGVLPGSKR
jgi:hypothetical protein